MHSIIIAGFPGTGKSFYANQYPTIAIDMESSDYHWKSPGEKDPSWPRNYYEAIAIQESYSDYRYIFTSTHPEVLNMLHEMGVPFMIAAPDPTEIFAFQDYLRRYLRRGNSMKYIENIAANWDEMLRGLYMRPEIVISIPKGEYIQDVLGRCRVPENMP